MTPELRDHAARVEALLDAGSIDGGRQLAELADRYAGDRTLYHRAVLLGRRQHMAASDAARRALAEEGWELLRAITADADDHAAEAEQRRERVERARAAVEQLAPERDIVLSAYELGRSYRKTDFSLRGVDLELRQGEILGVVGRNAHGKTTLLRLLAGELQHDAGDLDYPLVSPTRHGIDWVAVKEQIAYLPQDLPAWYGSLRNNLHYEAALHDLRGEENEREVEFIVERLGLGDELDKRWKELSGGTKLRFALARALVWKPRLLILDEPLANLDFKAQQTLLKDLRHLATSLRHPLAVVISSQHLHEVEAVSDRILFLRLGEVVYNGPRSAIGEQRDHNVFELDVDLDLVALGDLLDGDDVLDVQHSGVSFIVRTALDVTPSAFLRRLLDAGVEVEYFRNVSRSIKALFEEDGNPTEASP